MADYTPTATEGTWVPELRFAGATTGIEYQTRYGLYTRVGDLCFFHGHLHLSDRGQLAGDATIAGLPFKLHQAVCQLVVRDAPLDMGFQLFAVPDYPSDVDLSLYRCEEGRVFEQLQANELGDTSYLYVSGMAKIDPSV